jgi:hypothetical protein
MTHISEWINLVLAFFLYIPTLLGVIFGVSMTLGLLSRNSMRKWQLVIVAVLCVIVFTQVNAAFSEVIMEMLLSNQPSTNVV